MREERMWDTEALNDQLKEEPVKEIKREKRAMR